jgi:imidazole glycerol-phosphate synthase subunit HisH
MSKQPDPVILPTGVANTASVLAAFGRLGYTPRLSESPEDLRDSRWVVLPGVGSFGAAMERLHELGLADPLAERLAAGRPLLAVCVGLQVLASTSEESPGVAGFAAAPGEVKRFPPSVRVPQFGWNWVEPRADSRFLVPGYAYFANSFRLTDEPEGWLGATSEHGGPFVAAMERGDQLACQFHPELSGAWGLALIDRWLSATGGA